MKKMKCKKKSGKTKKKKKNNLIFLFEECEPAAIIQKAGVPAGSGVEQ